MITIERRLDVRLISRTALAQYMTYRELSVRKLALRAGLRPAIVGHLRSGKRTTCRPETAKAIERALDAPSGSLFLAELSPVSRETYRERVA